MGHIIKRDQVRDSAERVLLAQGLSTPSGAILRLYRDAQLIRTLEVVCPCGRAHPIQCVYDGDASQNAAK